MNWEHSVLGEDRREGVGKCSTCCFRTKNRVFALTTLR